MRDSGIEDIIEPFSENDSETRLRIIEELRGVQQRELLRRRYEVPDTACPEYG